jgi:hypothetical protein
MVTLPYTYFVSKYDEAIDEHHPVWDELLDHLKIFG